MPVWSFLLAHSNERIGVPGVSRQALDIRCFEHFDNAHKNFGVPGGKVLALAQRCTIVDF
jgi:hypothetical protein